MKKRHQTIYILQVYRGVCGVVHAMRRQVKKWVIFSMIQPVLSYSVKTNHYNDTIISTMASQISSLAIVYSTVYSDADKRKHQSSASLAFVREIHRWPVNTPHKWPVTRKMFPFNDVIMIAMTCGPRKIYLTHSDIACGSVWKSSEAEHRKRFPGPCCVNDSFNLISDMKPKWQII